MSASPIPDSPYRRSVIVRVGANRASAEMEDDPHHFGAEVTFDERMVTSVRGTAVRTPWTTCPAAAAQLRAFEGFELSRSPFDLLRLWVGEVESPLERERLFVMRRAVPTS